MSDSYRVIEIAKSWSGTPFLHGGRKRGIGVDCIGLISETMKEAFSEFYYKIPDYRDSKKISPHRNFRLDSLGPFFKRCKIYEENYGLIVFKLAQMHYHAAFFFRENSILKIIHAHQHLGVTCQNLSKFARHKQNFTYKIQEGQNGNNSICSSR